MNLHDSIVSDVLCLMFEKSVQANVVDLHENVDLMFDE